MTKMDVQIGSWITLHHMAIAEIMAGAGFQWLCLDLEHSVIDYYGMQVMLSSIQSKGVQAYVRVGGNDAMMIKRVLDAGADGIICPMINTAEQAKQLVAHVKYPPLGTRGVGLARAQYYALKNTGNPKHVKYKLSLKLNIMKRSAIFKVFWMWMASTERLLDHMIYQEVWVSPDNMKMLMFRHKLNNMKN
jgi:2-keto-3-deoxy-L-rhamnonate aldolase RhmA